MMSHTRWPMHLSRSSDLEITEWQNVASSFGSHYISNILYHIYLFKYSLLNVISLNLQVAILDHNITDILICKPAYMVPSYFWMQHIDYIRKKIEWTPSKHRSKQFSSIVDKVFSLWE